MSLVYRIYVQNALERRETSTNLKLDDFSCGEQSEIPYRMRAQKIYVIDWLAIWLDTVVCNSMVIMWVGCVCIDTTRWIIDHQSHFLFDPHIRQMRHNLRAQTISHSLQCFKINIDFQSSTTTYLLYYLNYTHQYNMMVTFFFLLLIASQELPIFAHNTTMKAKFFFSLSLIWLRIRSDHYYFCRNIYGRWIVFRCREFSN